MENKPNYESTIRKMITREDRLTNQRMLWLAAFNGLLCAGLGFAWGKEDAKFLAIVFSFLGFTSSFLNGLALTFSSRAQRRLLIWWNNNKPKPYNGPGVMGCEPLDKKKFSLYLTPWIMLSYLFVLGWLAIFLFVLGYIK
jgi:hypothetical protein